MPETNEPGQGTDPANPAGGAGEGGAPTSWLESLNDDAKGFVANKGWATPQDAIESYRTLESFRGVPEDRLVKLPGEGDTDAWGEVWNKLGRPEDPNEYEVALGETDPEGKASEWLKGVAHKLGLTKAQVREFSSELAEQAKANFAADTEAFQAKAEEDMRALRQEWGAAYEPNIAKARGAAGRLGLGDDAIAALESAMGAAGMLKFVHGLAAKMGEDQFEAGTGGADYGAIAPAQAKSRIAELKGDKDWTARYLKGDAGARAEMERLQRYANGKA